MRIAREEVFGPVVGVIPFDTDERGAADRERVAVRPVGVDLEPGHRARAACRDGASSRAWSRSTATTASTSRRRSAATSSRGSARTSGLEALDQYTDAQERVRRPRLVRGLESGPHPSGDRNDDGAADAGVPPAHPVADRVERRLERDLAPRDRLGRERAAPRAPRASSGPRRPRCAPRRQPRRPRPPAASTGPTISPGTTSRPVSSSVSRTAASRDRLVDLQEAARLRPPAAPGLDPPPEQDRPPRRP